MDARFDILFGSSRLVLWYWLYPRARSNLLEHPSSICLCMLVLRIIIIYDLTCLLNVSFRAKYLLQKSQQKSRSFI
jgi:hypothetical protein